ncbi:MAG: hypothetical protein ACK5L0_07050 [Candidatus Fimivivens sp.]
MEININEAHKIVEIWLTNAEKDDDLLKEPLKATYQKYHAKKYLVSVLHSGHQALYQATSDLLCYNRSRTTQLEADAARNNKTTAV